MRIRQSTNLPSASGGNKWSNRRAKADGSDHDEAKERRRGKNGLKRRIVIKKKAKEAHPCVINLVRVAGRAIYFSRFYISARAMLYKEYISSSPPGSRQTNWIWYIRTGDLRSRAPTAKTSSSQFHRCLQIIPVARDCKGICMETFNLFCTDPTYTNKSLPRYILSCWSLFTYMNKAVNNDDGRIATI